MAEEMQTGLGRDAPDGGGNGLLGALLSNPAMLGSLLSGLSAGGASEDKTEAASVSPAHESGGAAVDPSRAIGSLLSDPQMMAKLPEMIQMLKPLMGTVSSGGVADAVAAMASGDRQESGEKGDRDGKRDKDEARSVSAKDGGGGKCARERRIALLCALRPYMCPRRQEAIDYILKMDRLGKLFRNG